MSIYTRQLPVVMLFFFSLVALNALDHKHTFPAETSFVDCHRTEFQNWYFYRWLPVYCWSTKCPDTKKNEFGTVLYISKWKTIIINETMLTACQLRRRRHLCFIDELFLCSHDIFHLRNRHNWCLAAYFRCNKTKKNVENYTERVHTAAAASFGSSDSAISRTARILKKIRRNINAGHWPAAAEPSHTKSKKIYSVGTMSQHWNNYWIIVYLCVKLLSFHSFQIKTKWITWIV